DICPVSGVLPMTIQAMQEGFESIFLPAKNAAEAAIIEGIKIFPLNNIKELTEHIQLNSKLIIQPHTPVTQAKTETFHK
ncbi:MAG: hypothetical protein IJC24_06980, partial [Clostridia bacterium]|nr:hypothetical protein [Clostridia bacterium]